MNDQSYRDELLWIDIPNDNQLKIKCILNGQLDQPVVVFMHGKPGKPNGLMHSQTVKFFNSYGLTCLRPFLYSGDPKTRSLDNSNLNTYSQDYDTIINYLKKLKVKKIFAVA